MNQTRHQQLLQKYHTNNLTPSEYKEFIELMESEQGIDESMVKNQTTEDWKPSRNLLEKSYQELKVKRRRQQIKMWSWSSAAVIALLVMAWLFFKNDASVENTVYQTAYGETQNIHLPDGSTILLNANSTLTWNGAWEKITQRNVELDGEAFFDVQTIEDMPFTVDASGVVVQVTGTQFNVRNRATNTEVFLKEGEVKLQISDAGNNNRKGSAENSVTLQPGDFARINNSNKELTIENNNQLEKKAAWVDGMLDFENKTVADILKEFEDIYGKKFIIENSELAERRMDFSLPYSNWELVRKALEIAIGADFKIEQDTIIVK